MIDGHVHLEHGDLSVEYVLAFVEEAKRKGLDEIQILDHTHRFKDFEMLYDNLKHIKEQEKWLQGSKKFINTLEEYEALISQIKQMDLGIEVKFGLEVCFVPEKIELIEEILSKHSFDFVVGAVHSIDGILYDMPFSNKYLWEVYNVDDIYEKYYEIVFKLVKSGLFTQLAHPDTIKMFGYYPTYSLEETYAKLAKLCVENNVKAECNVGCYYRYNHEDLGLSEALLRNFKKFNTEIITASDAHNVKDVGKYMDEARKRVENMRVYNFSAGPAVLPLEALEDMQKNLVDYKGHGVSVMEMSHRSAEFIEIHEEAIANLRKAMDIPENYSVFFCQGGATMQFSMIPMNLLKNKADYLVTGSFSKKAYDEAVKFGDVKIANPEYKEDIYKIPNMADVKFREDADYVYLCDNNTIYGTTFQEYPENKLLIADMSSDILSRKVDVSKFGMIYAGTQKNMGIAGLAVVIMRNDLIEENEAKLPVLLSYNTYKKKDSMYNTPPTMGIYVLGEVVKWILEKGGVEQIEKMNVEKAGLLYDYLDSSDFYTALSNKDNRSMMNITFKTPNDDLDKKFVKQSIEADLKNLKGHRSVGGLRASIYNAMPRDGVVALIQFMKQFENENK